MYLLKHLLALACIILLSTPAQAQDKKKVEVFDLGWLDKNHLEHQVERIDEIARGNLGSQIRNSTDDLELLQRIINRGLIAKDDRLRLQAMGAVLGNVMAQEFGMVWQVYEDNLGRSRALCVEDTQHCLFPITMLSRRMEVGLLPNVKDIFDYCHEEIRPYLKRNPYDVTP
ncbi:hypothetical protein R50073_22460 [Maricurvus nonylphenolicus]|uniref:DUF3806 domain-containing protein n=1 Tax=Maricurvus nonylphenolicus TaxID=1008307 RepID=UPI0036F3D516